MFLEKLLPATGLYCVAQALPAPKTGFKHFFYSDLKDVRAQLNFLDRSGHTVYLAQATFDPEKITEAEAHNKTLPYGVQSADRKKMRTQGNALLLKNFFLDIDVGEKWPLKTQKEAAEELIRFVKETGLTTPAIVSSGNGLYAHWILADAIHEPQWKEIARLFKRVVAAYSPALGGDSSRTSDSASVLRYPGTTNRKPGREEKPVRLLHDEEPISLVKFADTLAQAAKRKQINRDVVLPPKEMDINADFYAGLEYDKQPRDHNLIADQCAQIGLMRSTKGDFAEPLWYSCIGVLVHCAAGVELAIHEWSSGYYKYDAAETDAKIAQWLASGAGPTTCHRFGEQNAEGCMGCRHNGKIKSPILLGVPAPEDKELPEEQVPAPEGFRRGVDGLFAEEEGRWIRFYDQDLYLDRLAYDYSLGYEVMTIKHSLPHEGDMACTVRSSMVNDPKMLLTTLSDNHIKVVGVKEKKLMTIYLESYTAKLQRARAMTKLLCQMGWTESNIGAPMFVLGRKIFHADGSVEDASLARNVPAAAEGFHSKGSKEAWVNATAVLNKPGMEPFAFALLCAFGAPLMKFTGFDGALVSMIGNSGVGKTMMLRMGLSIFGYHNDLLMLRDDTKNATVARLGVYGNLMLALDEVTNMPGMELSDFVYKCTQGRDKARLTKNSEEKRNINSWNTLVVTSSNASLVDKLSEVKHDASAEINRIFEYAVEEHPEFKGPVTTDLFWTIQENYGHAGEDYVQWLVQNVDAAKLGITVIRDRIMREASLKGEERFWGAVASVAIFGGMVASKLGLIKFDIAPILVWTVETLRGMRGEKQDLSGDAIGILGQFLDEHAGNRLIVKRDPRGAGWLIVHDIRSKLIVRYEIDTHKLFLSRNEFKQWLAKKFGSYSQVKNVLAHIGALVSANKRKVLGGGTFHGGSQQVCWELDMTCAKLGQVAERQVQEAEMLEKAPVQGNDEFRV